jgi:hypothetical protein
MDYTLACAPYPEPVLAFAGALALQAFLAGRKVRDEADNRTNLYLLALANSGAGKDFPRKVNMRVLQAADLAGGLGDTFASGEGLEDRLAIEPAMLFQTDEIDGLMGKIATAPDARFEGIMTVLLKMNTSANALYPLRVKVGRDPGFIDQPCLCLFGTAIPSNFYQAVRWRAPVLSAALGRRVIDVDKTDVGYASGRYLSLTIQCGGGSSTLCSYFILAAATAALNCSRWNLSVMKQSSNRMMLTAASSVVPPKASTLSFQSATSSTVSCCRRARYFLARSMLYLCPSCRASTGMRTSGTAHAGPPAETVVSVCPISFFSSTSNASFQSLASDAGIVWARLKRWSAVVAFHLRSSNATLR